ncbi:MAG: c-type cytochrome [Sphingobacterium thalpophilum]
MQKINFSFVKEAGIALSLILLLVLMASFNRYEGRGIPDGKDTISPWPLSFGFGRVATQSDIDRVDIDVRPDGKGLPAGSGNALLGKAIYQVKCQSCHSGNFQAGPQLITDTLKNSRVKTIGNYWPYASTVYDYINRAMPYNSPGSLTADEVYSLTAYLLHANKIIDEKMVLNAVSLPKISMPAQKMFIPDDRTGGPEIR